MRESAKTACFAAAAIAFAVVAARVAPERRTPSILSDQGEVFHPAFTDVRAVKTIEVVDYDESTATARPFKVEMQRGRWVIATNNNYPVDAGERLAKTSASLMDLKKDQVRSDSARDHERFGVIDPLDPKTASLKGRGKRVTLRGAGGAVLADFIFGRQVENKPGMRYVREPAKKRVYAVKTDADPSARFSDWVNSGIVRIPASAIKKVTIVSYSLDERTGRLDNAESLALTRSNGQWALAGGEKVNAAAVQGMATALDNLKIVDAAPKAPGLAASLGEGKLEVSFETAVSLRERGFFLTPNGRIVAGEGEMVVEMASGLLYHLRFGEVTGGDNRYLFITASGSDEARALNERFAGWYYVISNAEFQKMRLRKRDVTGRN